MNATDPGASHSSLMIVKIGGNVVDDAALLARTLDAFAALPGATILVHGGGVAAQRLAERLDVPQTMIAGRRVTGKETLDIAVMVYAGLISKQIVAALQARGQTAIGLSGADANCLAATKRAVGEIDYGFVGDVVASGVNTEFLGTLLSAGVTPVLCAITHDGRGELLNTNADSIASALAAAFSPLREVRALFCFDRAGVLHDAKNPDSVILELSESAYVQLRSDGAVSGGMIPKLDAAFAALRAGAAEVRIIHAAALAGLAAGVSAGGTTLVA